MQIPIDKMTVHEIDKEIACATGNTCVPFYSRDLNAANTLSKEAVKLGIECQYLSALYALPDCPEGILLGHRIEKQWLWAIAHADAMTRAKAFLIALRETNGK